MESQNSNNEAAEEQPKITEENLTMYQLKDEFERVVNGSFHLINRSSKNVLQRVFKKVLAIPFDESVLLSSSKEEKTLFEYSVMAMYLKDKMSELAKIERDKSLETEEEESNEQT